MPSTAITTIINRVESLPDELQEQLVEYVRAYIAEIEEEKRWGQSLKQTKIDILTAVNGR